ncbi:dynamin [Wolffia australiana]
MASGVSNEGVKSWKMENPFSFRVLQIFTGFGIGCGVGIGVGKPIYMGSIPAFQQVLSATQGAMDVFSGAGRHVNTNLRRVGIKNIEAGIGCGVGIGHGFGVGITLKPGAAHKLQAFVGLLIEKVISKTGPIPGLPLPQSPNNSTEAVTACSAANSRTLSGNVSQLTTDPLKVPSSSKEGSEKFRRMTSETPVETRTERVVKSFLDNPVFRSDEEAQVDDLARKLRSENNILQLLLQHQKIIDELIEENENLRRILVEDLRVSPSKVRGHGDYSELLERRRGRRR